MNIITVCSTATYDKFASVDQLKTLLGVTSTADDALMDELLVRASGAIETYVGYPLRKQTYLEQVPAYGTLYLQLDRVPIQSVTVVKQGNAALASTEYQVTDPLAGELYRESGWSWTAGMRTEMVQHVVPGSESKIWEVEYVAGYPPSSSTTTEIGMPTVVTQAALEIAKSWYLERKADPNVASKRVGDLAITYRTEQPGGGAVDSLMLPATAQRLLSPLRRVV